MAAVRGALFVAILATVALVLWQRAGKVFLATQTDQVLPVSVTGGP